MMKLWRLLCFLFLAVLSVSRGQSPSNDPALNNETKDGSTPTPPPLTPIGAVNTITTPTQSPTTASVSLSTNTSITENTTLEEHSTEDTTKEGSLGGEATTSANGGVPRSDGGPTVSTAGPGTSAKPAEVSSSSWGFVILALIIVLIIVLCIILYFLRRVSRSYSFDLHRPDPIINQFNEPTGTGFEPVYLDDLDRPAPKDQATTADLSPPPVTNGTSLQSEEKASNGETDLQHQPAEGGEATDGPSPPDGTDLLFHDPGKAPQNENNNNPSVSSSDPFVEINLDEPAWCDQLLTSADGPFSPFSFSSSISSS
ncbi:uncharacterized protein LOC115058570 [Echeneis naucrates]|uniref:uncharacterized protein LOC115058570 n=1 Tax=Echeneis naucrates TaxID=173247 RepID=UPI0011146A23|nr:uncharacterized protein LOC115058570 [Echeneis naucrates]